MKIKLLDGVISVNKFSGDKNSKFKLFVAVDPSKANMDRRGRWNSNAKSVMVDPNKIVFEAELSHDSYGQKVVAKIEDGKIFMSDMEAGATRVPSVSMMKIIEAQGKVKANSYIKLNDLLTAAGFEFVEDEPDIDLTQMSKNDLIKLVE